MGYMKASPKLLAPLALLQFNVALAEDNFFDLPLNDLVNVSIYTVSRSKEKLTNAPATAIILTQEDLRARGYRNLTEMFDDLPGMDLSRPFGDVYLNNIWRGFRKDVGSPYLLMIDGIVENDLYYNEADILAAIPMSNIQHIEIVYGPASPAYGANAFSGVINIITQNRETASKHALQALISAGSNDAKIMESNYRISGDVGYFQITGRYEEGVMDDSNSNQYEYTKESYLAAPELWGEFVLDSNYGASNSPRRNGGVDLRAGTRNLELALNHYQLSSGYGHEYPTDIAQNFAYWTKSQSSILLGYSHPFNKLLSAKLQLRYRESGIEKDSDFLEGLNSNDPNSNNTIRLVDYSFWQVENHSDTLSVDFSYEPDQPWLTNFGIKHEKKDLQKAARVTYGPSLAPQDIDLSTYPIPEKPESDVIPHNRINTEDLGIYALSKYFFEADSIQHVLDIGIRFDKNSEYGTARTLRSGYIGSSEPWTWKLLFGESFREPPPRLLYGGWLGSGSDPNLEPEEADTWEGVLIYTQESYQWLISAYVINADKTLTNFSGGATNLGEQTIKGVDFHWKSQSLIGSTFDNATLIEKLNTWFYYSYMTTQQDSFDTQGNATNTSIGDSANHKLHAGIALNFEEFWQFTLRGRYIGSKKTVNSNPLDKIPAYYTADINIRYLQPHYEVAVAITNLFDKSYTQPGVRQADAGEIAGAFNEQGEWQGSAGFFNSALPQESRSLMFSLLGKF